MSFQSTRPQDMLPNADANAKPSPELNPNSNSTPCPNPKTNTNPNLDKLSWGELTTTQCVCLSTARMSTWHENVVSFVAVCIDVHVSVWLESAQQQGWYVQQHCTMLVQLIYLLVCMSRLVCPLDTPDLSRLSVQLHWHGDSLSGDILIPTDNVFSAFKIVCQKGCISVFCFTYFS